MSIAEYINVKKKYYGLKINIRAYSEEAAKKASKKLLDYKSFMDAAEETDDVKHYLSLRKKRTALRRRVSSPKCTSSDKQSLYDIEQEIYKLESPCVTPPPTPPLNPSISSSNNTNIVDHSNNPVYYIISLAWSGDSNMVTDCVMKFLCSTNYIEKNMTHYDQTSENILNIKYSYDTTEEIAVVKSLLIAGSHIISAFNTDTNVEVYGKIQKY